MNNAKFSPKRLAIAVALLTSAPAFAQSPSFTPGNIVVVTSGCGVWSGLGLGCPGAASGNVGGYANNYGDNQGSPMTLLEFTTGGSYVKSLVLPQVPSGANFPVSAEYGSSSEGTLQVSGNNQYLTVGGYGINAATYNGSPLTYTPYPAAYSKSAALAQSGSLTGQSYTAVPRVVALIDANGNVNSTTALYNVFSTNNIRSAFTANGTSVYVSGQGQNATTTSPFGSFLDATGGVFYSATGAANNSPASITGADAGSGTSQETNEVQIYGSTLYVSSDAKEGANNRDYIGTLPDNTAGVLPTTVSNSGNGPVQLNNFGTSNAGKETLTSGANSNGNNLNTSTSNLRKINLSPQNYFFASPQYLYVADSGNPKNDSNGDTNSTGSANIGDGGLQKWMNSAADGSGTWTLLYTLYKGLGPGGLGPVNNGSSTGTSGLYGLAGVVSGNNVSLYATNYTLSDLDPTYLYEITDNVTFSTASQASGESFTQLAQAPADSNFKGVAIVPTTPANSVAVTTSPSGLAFTSMGAGCAAGSYTTPITLTWTPSSSCNLTVTSPTGATGVRYVAQWQDGTIGATDMISFAGSGAGSPAVYSASFITQYLLTTSAGTGGMVSAGGYVDAGANARITATPSTGYYFVNFTGAVTSTSNPLSLPMNAPQSITANFAPQVTPTITWAAPAAITFGGALSSVQLDATASVPGTFVYTPPVGTVLPVGSGQTLSVAFTPTNTAEYTKATGSTTITVNPASAPASPANLVVTKVLTRSGGNVIVQLTVANTGGTAAANVTINSVTVGADAATPLPKSLGTIAAGASVQATVTVPGTVGASGAASSLAVTGTYTGGTFSSGARITLP